MHKNSLKICGFTVGAGAFGMFFRWLQNQSVFEADTGLVKPSALNIIVPLVIALAAVLFFGLLKGLRKQGYCAPESFYEAFAQNSKAYTAASWVFGVLMAVGGAASLRGTAAVPMSALYAVFALLAVLSGLSFPLVCAAPRSRYSPGLICVLMTLPIILFTLWLILSYRVHASIPAVWSYAIEILSLSVALVAFFLAAGYAYGVPRPMPTMFMTMLAAFMCIMSLADAGSFGQKLVFAASAGMFVLYAWTLAGNLGIASPDEARTDDAPVSPDEPVIEAGPAEPEPPEPTVQFPAGKKRTDSKSDVDRIIEDIKNGGE